MEYIRSEVNSLGALNAELEKIETALDAKVGTQASGPRVMHSDLDMNSNQILNLPAPSSPTEPIRLLDIPEIVNQVQGSNYIGEDPPAYQFEGLRWYVPSSGTTFVWDVTNGNGSWVEEPVQSFDGQLRKDLEDGTATVGGVVAASIIDNINALLNKTSKVIVYNGTDTVADTAAIQAILDAMPANHNLVLNGPILINNTLTIKTDNFAIEVNGTVKAAAGSDFEYMLFGTGRYRVAVVGGVFDANRLNRTSPKTIRRMCVAFVASTECGFFRVTAVRAEGYSNIPGVGIVVAGASTRGYVINCYVQDCGGNSGTDAADGCFTSGAQNIINNLVGNNCTDTLAVIESSDYSIMNNITGYNCACVAAITNASADGKRGNIMSNVTGINWKASNTGGIQIGCPAATNGHLYDTVVSNVSLYAETGLGFGVGAAINIRQVGFGRVKGLTLENVRINGATTQGILCDGDEIEIANGAVKNTTDGCVQFQTGSSGEVVNMRLTGGSFGVVASGTAQVVSKINTIKSSTSAGIAAFGTAVIDSVMDVNKATTKTSKDAGATINHIGTFSGGLSVGTTMSAVPAGANLGGEPVYDRNGTLKGYVTVRALS